MIKVPLSRSTTSVFGNLERLPDRNHLYWPPVARLSKDQLKKQSSDKPFPAKFYSFLSFALPQIPWIALVLLIRFGIVSYDGIRYKIYLCLALEAAALGLARWCKDRSIRLSKVDAQELVKLDPRPPVLILRTYRDDDRGTVKTDFLETVDPEAKVGHQLNAILSSYGPVITLENPSTKTPLLGPSTKRMDDETWQQEVLSDLERAGLIIIIAGLGRWLFWELNQVVERGLLYRTILIIPPYFGDQEIEDLRAMAKDFEVLDKDICDGPAHFRNYAHMLMNLKALCDRAEFESIRHITIDNTLIIRWSTDGEAIVVQDHPRTFKGILQALGLCASMSGLRTHEPELNTRPKPLK